MTLLELAGHPGGGQDLKGLRVYHSSTERESCEIQTEDTRNFSEEIWFLIPANCRPLNRRDPLTMDDPKSVYRREDGKFVIELVLRNVMQLFNSFDPSPFHEKELDSGAEEYLFNTLDDLPIAEPVKLVIYLPPEVLDDDIRRSITLGIHNHFSYRSAIDSRELKRLFKRGRQVLFIAVVLLFISLLARQYLARLPQNIIVGMAQEAFLIFGWVVLWEPVYIFIYGWWPITKKRRIHEKIMDMEIDIRPTPSPIIIGPVNR
jgi:hypothetical protein